MIKETLPTSDNTDLYSDATRETIARRFFEPHLVTLGLTEAQLMMQSQAELARSLQHLEDALSHPEGFGVLRLKLTPQGYVVALATSSYHYETTITPLLLERKQWIQEHLRAASVSLPTTDCADLEIHVLPRSGDDYPVDLTLDGEHVWRGRMSAGVTAWTSGGDSAEDGQRLFDLLFADPALRSGWAEARGLAPERRIRLWLDVDEPALHTLPWELLRDDGLALAANARTPFSRYLPGRQEWGAAVIERPLRMLAVIANPADLPEYTLTPLDVAAERDLLTSALQSLPPDLLHLEFLDPPVTLARLEACLRAQPYHILHYVGHGAFNVRRDQAVLYLEDATGTTNIMRDAALAEMLERMNTPPLLVFLAACRSGQRSPCATFAGLAPRLARAGIPAVAAMQDDVAIAATHALSAAFYPQLLFHGRVDRALNEARSALMTDDFPDAATPVLLMRLRDGRLFEV